MPVCGFSTYRPPVAATWSVARSVERETEIFFWMPDNEVCPIMANAAVWSRLVSMSIVGGFVAPNSPRRHRG